MTSARKRQAGQRISRLSGLSEFLTRHPRAALVSWGLVAAALAFVGRDLPNRLEAHHLFIDGTEAKLAHEITLRQFGGDESMIVVLRGPRAEVVRQAKALVGRVDSLPNTTAVSPWSAGGAIKGLRPTPRVAGVVVRVGHGSNRAVTESLELVEGQVEKMVRPPVHASIAGQPKIFASYAHASTHAANIGELIALPVLLLVLLLVFRSVIAALIPVIAGGIVVSATQGVMRLLLGVVEMDAFALGAAGMMGLALGVDYSLLVVSRFREERTRSDLPTAVRTTVEATARSILPAAGGLLLAMLIASQVLPGAAVTSSALAIVIATVFSAFSALWAVPATILLLGDNLERWSLPRRLSARGALLGISNRFARNPVAVGAIVLVLLILGGLSSTLDTGVATPELLPPDENGRIEAERVEDALGPGWVAPIEVVVSGSGEPMTSPSRLRSLVAFQDRVERTRGVETVAGFSALERGLHPLSRFESRLVERQHDATRLSSALARTDNGARRSSGGLREAASGASRIGRGVEAAQDGSGLLAKGAEAAGLGTKRLTAALSHASGGSQRLSKSSFAARSGAKRLAETLEKGKKKIRETDGNINSMKTAMRNGNAELGEAKVPLGAAEARLAAAWQAMQNMTAGKSDPEYATLQRDLREARESLGESTESEEAGAAEGRVAGGITRAQRQFELGLYLARKIGSNNHKASEGTDELAKEAHRLERGIRSLAEGASRVAAGVSTLSAEGSRLSPALQRLTEGTESLARGLGRLTGGTSLLAGGLDGGASAAQRLAAALHRLHAGIESSPEELQRLRRRSPNLFRSGYFYLAGLDGGDSSRRALAGFVIDLGQGGHTARMMVIPRQSITTSQGQQTLARVREDAHAFARATGTEAVVGGLSARELAVSTALQDRTALARLAMMLVTLLVLIPVMRSLTMPVIAAFLNLLTVFATLGVVALLFNGSLLGGPGYVDAADVPAMVMVIFGLAIDYEVFIFARMREEYVRTGSPAAAVEGGLARTAPVVTGAAVIMITVFLCFSISEFVTLRNFGVGQAIAISIDAFVIRLIVVPAVMKRLGRWSWWMPSWLDRLLPGGASGPER